MDKNSSKRYEELDALRGIAALMVVFFHFTMDREEYNFLFKYGTTGVDLFFIISGFVIFMSINKIATARDFIINRISRLYPTYWSAVTFTFIIMVIFSIFKGSFNIEMIIKYLGNMTMFQYYLKIPNLDHPYWTMIVEMLFYISILILYKLKALNHLNLIGGCLCGIVFSLTHFVDIGVWDFLSTWFPLIQFIPLFFAGTLFYKIFTERKQLFVNYGLIGICLITQISLYSYSGKSLHFIYFYEYAIMLLLFFGIFYLFVNNQLGFIVNRVTLFLGKISFALYLIHQYVSLNFIIPGLYKKLHLNFWVTTVLINLPILIVISAFITYKIEIPFGRRLKNVLRKL